MAIRFQKHARFLLVVTLNMSKRGVSTSLGPRGAKMTLHSVSPPGRGQPDGRPAPQRSGLWIGLLLTSLSTGAAAAIPLECAINERTDAHQCVAPSEIREINGIRVAPLYVGGPNKLRKTTFTAHANCSTKVLHLKDSDGVSFGGGHFNQTEMTQQLSRVLCAAVAAVPKKK